MCERFEYHREDPTEPDLYQTVEGQIGDQQVEDVTEYLDQFAHSLESSRVLLITGPPGCGKTTLLERLTWDLASEAHSAMVDTHGRPYIPGQDRALDYPKHVPVAVLMRLWGFQVSREYRPENHFCQAMTRWGGSVLELDQHKSPANILRDRDLHFVVMMDGLDEIPYRNKRRWERALDALHQFVARYPSAKFIVTCREDQFQNMGPEWDGYVRLRVGSMSLRQTYQYLGGTNWEMLLDREDIMANAVQLLVNPRRVEALCETEFVSCSLGAVLHGAIEGFLGEEFKRYRSSHAERFRLRTKTREFAAWLLGQGLREIGEETAREKLGHRNFNWLYRAKLLILHQHRCCFVDPRVHDYFVADQLLSLHHNQKRRSLTKIARVAVENPDLWQTAICISANLWPDDLTEEPMAALMTVLAVERRIRAFTERQYSAVADPAFIEEMLWQYLEQPDVDLFLVERAIWDRDPAVQRAAIRMVGTTRYLEATDILADIAERSEDDELQYLAALALANLNDPRGEELLAQEGRKDEIIEEWD